MRKRFIQDMNTGKLIEVGMDYVNVNESNVPYIIPDITEYKSMVDGSQITSRSHHRAHLKRHGLIEVGNEIGEFDRIRDDKERRQSREVKELVRDIASEKLRHK